MKCNKCSFVSFDYLSACKKCGADLSIVREGLRLPAVKPSIPSFLGSILKPGIGVIAGDTKEQMKSSESAFPEIDFGEDLDFGLGGSQEDAAVPVASAQSTSVVSNLPADLELRELEALVNNSNFEISDEELRKSLEETGTDKDLDLDLAMSLNSDFGLDKATPPRGTDRGSDPLGLDLGGDSDIQISDEDAEKLLQDLSLEIGPGDGQVENLEPKKADGIGEKTPLGDLTLESDSIVEISESDLENLLLELDEVSQDKGKGGRTGS